MLRNVCLSFRAIWVTRIGEVSSGRETIVQVLGGGVEDKVNLNRDGRGTMDNLEIRKRRYGVRKSG